MSDELVTLRDHLLALMAEKDKRDEQRFEAQEKAVRDALLAAEKAVAAALTTAKEAVAKAETATEKRFESVNEFRSALTDAQTRFATSDAVHSLEDELDRRLSALRDEYLRNHVDLVKRVEANSEVIAATTGTSAGTMRIFLVAAVALSLISVIAGIVDIISR